MIIPRFVCLFVCLFVYVYLICVCLSVSAFCANKCVHESNLIYRHSTIVLHCFKINNLAKKNEYFELVMAHLRHLLFDGQHTTSLR